MEKKADLIVNVLQNGNILYLWWCLRCQTYHHDKYCPYDCMDDNDDFYYSMN